MAMSFQKDHATQDVASTSTIATAARTPAAQNASTPRSPSSAGQSTVNASSTQADAAIAKKKTLAEIDAELALKMAELAGDGGMAGVELEEGQPTAMKRGVRNNMFRYI